jgi:hypothetical protein
LDRAVVAFRTEFLTISIFSADAIPLFVKVEAAGFAEEPQNRGHFGTDLGNEHNSF